MPPYKLCVCVILNVCCTNNMIIKLLWHFIAVFSVFEILIFFQAIVKKIYTAVSINLKTAFLRIDNFLCRFTESLHYSESLKHQPFLKFYLEHEIQIKITNIFQLSRKELKTISLYAFVKKCENIISLQCHVIKKSLPY